jgi:hypothetical protein
MSSQSQRSLNWLLQQFQLKPGKPDIAASLQTLVLVLVPIGVGVLMGHPAASAIAVMGAWSVGLVNVEGAYRQQATAKIATAISITAMLFLKGWNSWLLPCICLLYGRLSLCRAIAYFSPRAIAQFQCSTVEPICLSSKAFCTINRTSLQMQ